MFAKYKNGEVSNIETAEPEMPTRVVKQLKKLLILLANVRGHDKIAEEDMMTIVRVVRDSSARYTRKAKNC